MSIALRCPLCLSYMLIQAALQTCSCQCRSRDSSARNSYEVLSPASNHNREAALLVAQYLSQSPRNAEDLATGYGALRRGQRADEEASAFSVGSHLPFMTAARQQSASEREPLARAASTPVRPPSKWTVCACIEPQSYKPTACLRVKQDCFCGRLYLQQTCDRQRPGLMQLLLQQQQHAHSDA